jgi:membrane fusion protein, heavy metal efflux system
MKHALTALTLIVLPLGTAAAQPATVRLDAAEQTRAGVAVSPAAERSFADQVRVVGQVVGAPGSTVAVKSVVAGRVEEILVSPGDRVRMGQPLIVLHSHAVLTLHGELLRTHRELQLAQNRLDAGRQLYELEGISRMELDRRSQEALAARLAYEQARAELIDLGYTEEGVDRDLEEQETEPHLTVRAPAPGVVLDLPVQQHEWIESYATLTVLGDPAQVELQLQLPPDEAHSVTAGDDIRFGLVGRDADQGRAVVATRVPRVDPQTRTVMVRARILDAPGNLFPGVFVEGMLQRGAARTAVSVPEAAVTRIGEHDAVFVRQGPETFAVRQVSLGRHGDAAYEVTDGLSVGEEIATAGVFFLKSALLKGSGGES